MKKNKITAVLLSAVLLISGCAENKAPAASGETVNETSATAPETSPAATETSGTAPDTTTAASETTTVTSPVTMTSAEQTLGGKTVSSETSEITTEPPAETGTLAPEPPKIDEDMFTLYIGGSEQAEKYDVEVKAMTPDVTAEVMKKLEADKQVIFVRDSGGAYSIGDWNGFNITELKTYERMLSRENYEKIKEALQDTEYAEMSYEDYVREIIQLMETFYPGTSDLFDENMKLKDSPEDGDILLLRCDMRNDFKTAYCDNETVYKEGLNRIFDLLENDSGYKEFAKGLNSGDELQREAVISYNGGYCLAVGVSVNTASSGKWERGDMVWLGKAKIYETEPKHLTRQIFSSDYKLFEEINTDDNPYEMSLEIISEGYRGDGIIVDESGYSYIMTGDMTVGKVPEISKNDSSEEYGFEFGEIKQVWIKFRIKEGYRGNVLGKYVEKSPDLAGIGRLYVFAFDEDINISVPLETWHDEEENTVWTVTDGILGTFSLVDFEIWIDQFAQLE
ncbi:MAG: hypothetical protein K5876_01015 [Ruminiclostridium sp.]|nr:hypothetical protein [Ruminiclostridium sp.]